MSTNNILFDEYKKLNIEVETIYISHDLWKMKKYNEYLYLLYESFIHNPSNPKIVFLKKKDYLKMLWRRVKGEKSLFHQHWLDFYGFKKLHVDLYRLIILSVYKLFGGKIIWTIHNKLPHNKKQYLLNLYGRQFFAMISNKLHVHCDSAIDIMKPILKVKEKKFFVVSHPHYPAIFMNKENARSFLQNNYIEYNIEKLENFKTVYLIFGQISKYKGILELVIAWESIADEHSLLIIAGMTKITEEEYSMTIKKTVDKIDNILWINEYIPNTTIPYLFNAVDTVVFNYQDILTSGGVILAKSYKKPIIAPEIGCLKELTDENTILFSNIYDLKL